MNNSPGNNGLQVREFVEWWRRRELNPRPRLEKKNGANPSPIVAPNFFAFSDAKFHCFRACLQDLICPKVPIYVQRPAFGRECFWGAFFSILRSQPNYLTEGGNFWRF